MLSVTDVRSNPTVYTYDNMDRLATRKDPLLRTETHLYDLSGNRSQFTDRKSQAATYTYDGLDRRTGVTYADISTTSNNGNLQTITDPSGTTTSTWGRA